MKESLISTSKQHGVNPYPQGNQFFEGGPTTQGKVFEDSASSHEEKELVTTWVQSTSRILGILDTDTPYPPTDTKDIISGQSVAYTLTSSQGQPAGFTKFSNPQGYGVEFTIERDGMKIVLAQGNDKDMGAQTKVVATSMQPEDTNESFSFTWHGAGMMGDSRVLTSEASLVGGCERAGAVLAGIEPIITDMVALGEKRLTAAHSY